MSRFRFDPSRPNAARPTVAERAGMLVEEPLTKKTRDDVSRLIDDISAELDDNGPVNHEACIALVMAWLDE